MLSQMGYQKGQGLGKDQSGRAEPIDLLIKDKRTGLGMDEERKRKREEAEKMEALRGLHIYLSRTQKILAFNLSFLSR